MVIKISLKIPMGKKDSFGGKDIHIMWEGGLVG